MAHLSDLEMRVLDEWQRAFPLVPRPYAVMANALSCSETELLGILRNLRAAGTLARVGATCRPNTVGASTLAALSVPDWRIEEVAEIINAEDGVNHSYLREHDWNIWIVATAADTAELAALLVRISERTGLKVMSLPLKRAFNVDLGFKMTGPRHALRADLPPDMAVVRDGDRAVLQALTEGLPLTPAPFADMAAELGLEEAALIGRIKALAEARIITRIGVIVRHRALGWRSNAMVTWKLPPERIGAAGNALLQHSGVTLCYERALDPDWDYPLFSMVHAKTRAEALRTIAELEALPELEGAEKQVLFSVRCFKQTGATLARRPRMEAAE